MDLILEQLKNLQTEKSALDINYFNLQEELQQLRDKLRFLNKNGEIDLAEINEALALLRLKRDKGISLEFLEKIDDLHNVYPNFNHLHLG